MKRSLQVFCCILVIFISSSPVFNNLSAQDDNQFYFAIQYLRVQPEQESEYLQLELEVWKKMQEARIKADVCDGWYFFRVVAPIGSSTEYNYLTINVYDSPEKLANHFENFGVDYTAILSPEEISLALRTETVRELVYEEVWTAVDQVLNLDPQNMYRFQVFNSMKLRPGTEDSEYERMETEYWKPMHLKRIEQGVMSGWGLYTMIIPGGTERNYHWATVDFYDHFIDYLGGTGDLMVEIHGAEKAAAYTDETITKRDLLKAEVRELIGFANEATVTTQ